MIRRVAILSLLWLLFSPAVVWLWAANPVNPTAARVQGPDSTGNLGYPVAVVQATGSSWPVTATATKVGTPADAFTTPTLIPQSQSFPQIYNGATWDLLRSANGANGTTGAGLAGFSPMVFDGTNYQRVRGTTSGLQSLVTTSGAFANQTSAPGLLTDQAGATRPLVVGDYVYLGLVSGNASSSWSRTPSVFKTVSTAANGSTALWTPTAGTKFRVMAWRYTITDNATLAAPGVLTVSLLDSATATGQVDDVFVPGAALNTSGQLVTSPWVNLGNGYLSAAANNVLNVNLSAALATGSLRVQVCGTEE